jgi:hypothetical protein
MDLSSLRKRSEIGLPLLVQKQRISNLEAHGKMVTAKASTAGSEMNF